MITNLNHILRRQLNKLFKIRTFRLKFDSKNRNQTHIMSFFLSHTITTGILFSKGKECSKTTLCYVHQIHDSREKRQKRGGVRVVTWSEIVIKSCQIFQNVLFDQRPTSAASQVSFFVSCFYTYTLSQGLKRKSVSVAAQAVK